MGSEGADQKRVGLLLSAARYKLWRAMMEASCLKDDGIASDISDLLPEVDRILLSIEPWRTS